MVWRGIIALLCACVVAGCGAATSGSTPSTTGDGMESRVIEISNAWVRPMAGAGAMDHSSTNSADEQPTSDAMSGMDMSGFSSTAYMTIRNTGSADDQLLKASTDVAMTVELHDNTNTNGVMSMNQVQTVAIPTGGTVEFKPAGLHMMLIGLKHDLNAGDTVALSLQFEKAGTVNVNAVVREQ